jgi:hypothetical protein
MTVLLEDATATLGTKAQNARKRGDLAEILYADDTLLVGVDPRLVEEYLAAICKEGSKYGMELHSDKFQLLCVRRACQICCPDGRQVAESDDMEYLGTVLSNQGGIGRELSRRIGIAKGDFATLMKVWKHTCLCRRRKLEIYKAIVETKLLFSLSSACLTKAEQRRLDGFQNRCVRQIFGILPSYFSRVSNADVLATAGCRKLTDQVGTRQLFLLGKILRAPEARRVIR